MNLIFVLMSLFFSTADDRPTLYLIGDSTCANKAPIDQPETGWGMAIGDLLIDAIRVENHAVNGRSTKSFRNLGHWKTVLNQLKPGDYVLMQFGHNDAKESDTTRFAPAKTDYKHNLKRYVAEIRAKGGIPIIASPLSRRNFDENGVLKDSHADYPSAAKEVAFETNVDFIDATSASFALIKDHGVQGSKKIFMHYGPGVFRKHPNGVADNTHFSPYGAQLMAKMMAAELSKSASPLKAYLKKSKFKDKFEFELPSIYVPYFKKDTFDISRYGAKDDGQTLNTEAINQAIKVAHEKGGGVVLIPKGLWLTGPITLASEVNLHLEKGAVVQFSRRSEDFPLIPTNWEGVDAIRAMSPLNGKDLENVAITGEGVFDGGGEAWRPVKKSKMTDAQWQSLLDSGGVLNETKDSWYPTDKALAGSKAKKPGVISEGWDMAKAETIKEFLRPNMLSLTHCQNVLIEGILFQNSPAWTLHPLLCQHLTVRNVSVKNPWYGQNNDAIDVESCVNFVIDGCSFDTGDDGICIKSGRDAEGRKRGVPTQNGIIKNTRVFKGHGGFVIGSEMSGGVNNLFVSDCDFLGTDVGLRFKTARGRGGIVEKIYISDIRMMDIQGEAILFDMYYMAKDPVLLAGEKASEIVMEKKAVDEGTPQFRDFSVDHVVCKGAAAGILIRGLPEMKIKNIKIENSSIEAQKGFECTEGQNICLQNVALYSPDTILLSVMNSKNVLVEGLKGGNKKQKLIQISGKETEDVEIRKAAFAGTNDVILGSGAQKKMVKIN